MQVAHQADHVTHAVLGGQSNISFGISDDPAFFQILSSALYKDPMLAMVRETICNAWDAHIDSGLTAFPLTITLTNDKLIIRDFGKGIPKDLIGPIYGVYGASTKKNDGRQTGGFGLGCKSPFAYTDHFEVISNHGGERTIYRMSKSSAEKLGKPSIVPIATFPTQETGIQVTIPLKGDGNDHRIESLVRQVVFNGDILARLNNETLPVLGLSEAESGFILVNEAVGSDGPAHQFDDSVHRIFLRYGNVIYPVESSSEIASLHDRVANMLNKLYGCRLILMSPPDSISITPSRESMTYSEITVQTVTMLLSNFLAHIMQNRALIVRHKEIVNEYIDTAATDERTVVEKLRMDSWVVPGVPETTTTKFLTTLEDFAQLEILLRYSNRNGDLKADKWLVVIERYLLQMLSAGLIERSMVQTWLATAKRVKKTLRAPATSSYRSHYWQNDQHIVEIKAATAWWYKMVGLPTMKKILAVSPLIKKEMIFYQSNNLRKRKQVGAHYLPKAFDSVQLRSHTSNLAGFVKPVVVLTHNMETISKRIGNLRFGQEHSELMGKDYFIVQITRAKDDADKLRELFEDSDFTVSDLTGRLPYEEDAYQERLQDTALKRAAYAQANPAAPKLVKKARPGLIRFDQLLNSSKNAVRTLRLTDVPDLEKITDMQFIVKVSTAAEKQDHTDTMGTKLAIAVARVWGSVGGVTNNSAVYNRQIGKKVMDVDAFLLDKMVNELAHSTEIKAYLNFNPELANDYLRTQSAAYHACERALKLYKAMLQVPELQFLVPGYTPLTEENYFRATVWKQMAADYQLGRRDDVKEAKETMGTPELSEQTKAFLDQIIASPFLGLIDQDSVSDIYAKLKRDPTKVATLVNLIQLIIN